MSMIVQYEMQPSHYMPLTVHSENKFDLQRQEDRNMLEIIEPKLEKRQICVNLQWYKKVIRFGQTC